MFIVRLHESRNREIDNSINRITLQFDKRLRSSISEQPVQYHSDHTILNSHLAAKKICDILR